MKNDLFDECFRIAQSTHWKTRPIDAEPIQRFAEMLYQDAIHQAQIVVDAGGSMEAVTRAVSYILHAHANPSIGNDVSWFSTTLETLIEVIYPTTKLEGAALEFLLDIQKGILSQINLSICEDA